MPPTAKAYMERRWKGSVQDAITTGLRFAVFGGYGSF